MIDCIGQEAFPGCEQAPGVRLVRGEAQQQALGHARNLAASPVRPAWRGTPEVLRIVRRRRGAYAVGRRRVGLLAGLLIGALIRRRSAR